MGERDTQGQWRTVTYGEALADAGSLGTSLVRLGLGPNRPLMILSGNSISHLLVTLGAMLVGIPVVPVTAAYSLLSRDHARLKTIAAMVTLGAVFVESPDQYHSALAAINPPHVIVERGSYAGISVRLDDLRSARSPTSEEPIDGLNPDGVAKILFTSGSTGDPKGVLTTHRMLAANQQMMRQAWPFLSAERPVIVDWLPWSHTFGGSHNVNLVITNGGTIYIDAGRPSADLFAPSVANLTEIAPTIYFNVPAGYACLVPVLESDNDFARRFFSRLRLLFNAAAGLPPGLRDRLERIAEKASGRKIAVTASWGATETGPAATTANFAFSDARCIGVPLPGAELRLIPNEGAYEVRVRGPMVTSGYLKRADLTQAAFDELGYYRTGDAVEFADPADPSQGLLFRGRLAEDFKLSTGTFVRVGTVRTTLLGELDLASDVVIAGENREYISALVWLDAAAVGRLLGREPSSAEYEVVTDPAVLEHLSSALSNASGGEGSAGLVQRLLVLGRPPDFEAAEITDKGYVNQRRVIANRADLVEMLYTDPPPLGVVIRRARQ